MSSSVQKEMASFHKIMSDIKKPKVTCSFLKSMPPVYSLGNKCQSLKQAEVLVCVVWSLHHYCIFGEGETGNTSGFKKGVGRDMACPWLAGRASATGYSKMPELLII